MVEDKETDNMMLKFNTNQIKAVDWLLFLLCEIIKIFIQMVLTGYTSGSILSIEVKTTAHEEEKTQMKREEVLKQIYEIAKTLINEKTHTFENYNKCFSLAIDFNREHEEREEIFVCEMENGICIEDDTFVFEN